MNVSTAIAAQYSLCWCPGVCSRSQHGNVAGALGIVYTIIHMRLASAVAVIAAAPSTRGRTLRRVWRDVIGARLPPWAFAFASLKLVVRCLQLGRNTRSPSAQLDACCSRRRVCQDQATDPVSVALYEYGPCQHQRGSTVPGCSLNRDANSSLLLKCSNTA